MVRDCENLDENGFSATPFVAGVAQDIGQFQYFLRFLEIAVQVAHGHQALCGRDPSDWIFFERRIVTPVFSAPDISPDGAAEEGGARILRGPQDLIADGVVEKHIDETAVNGRYVLADPQGLFCFSFFGILFLPALVFPLLMRLTRILRDHAGRTVVRGAPVCPPQRRLGLIVAPGHLHVATYSKCKL